MRHYTMAFTHKYTEITLETLKGKTSFLRASLALFVSFIALYKMFTIQYKVSTNLQNPNSKTRIRKPWAEKPNTMDCKTAKNNPIFFLGGSTLEPTNLRCRYGFGANAPKTDRGGHSGLPPSDASASRVKASQHWGQTPCKEYNINPTI